MAAQSFGTIILLFTYEEQVSCPVAKKAPFIETVYLA